MRGKVYNSSRVEQRNRITPAYAGKRQKTCALPETCAGSPPPMRGKAVVCVHRHVPAGITPAYAGKSGNFTTMDGAN